MDEDDTTICRHRAGWRLGTTGIGAFLKVLGHIQNSFLDAMVLEMMEQTSSLDPGSMRLKLKSSVQISLL
jgi:hypothetical protein